MTSFNGMEDVRGSNAEVYGHDGAASPGCAENCSSEDHRQLTPIFTYLRREIDNSAAMLRDLAEHLSRELLTLGTADDDGEGRSSLSVATMALQNEDRVQQRLSDMGALLSVLEQASTRDDLTMGADLKRAIVACLRLEETRTAFAVDVGLADAVSHSSSTVKAPSVGEIDLF